MSNQITNFIFMKLHITNSIYFMPKHSLSRIRLLMYLAFLAAPFLIHSQVNPLPTRYQQVDKRIDSKKSLAKSNSQIITETITEPGATWLRLFFDNVNLGKNSTLTITSELDGAVQQLNASTIKDWKNTSAYFNGDKVTLQLTIASGEKSVGFDIKELGIGIEAPAIAKSQCGSVDDRIDSNDAAIGRMVPVGCTGWIITNGRLVTAGHCVGSRAQIIEFNVPKSNPNRSIVHPGPEDQYPIGNFVSPYPDRPSQATDWAVFTASANTQTGLTPIQAQGKSFNVVRSNPGSNITITGFGTDTGIDNQTQQIHTGPLSSVTNTFVRYRTDTTGGNSGSPIIDTATGNAVGVHAYGGCSGSGGSNSGERATIPAFWDAMGLDNTPPPPPPSQNCSGDVSSFPFNESFETNLGQWSNTSSGDDIDWTRDSEGTPSSQTGPSTGANGNFYIYVEASGNGTGYPNKRAILNSPCLDFADINSPSLNFSYHMFGSAINSLNVEARTNNSGAWTSVFSRNGAQGNQWNTANVNLSRYSGEGSVQLRFNVVTGSGGNGWQSDIAIDAISIQNGTADPTPDPDPSCPTLNFNDFQITSFSNQDTAGDFAVSNGGASLSMQNNTWKYIPLNYTVTANTVIEFDFSSTSQGEIHGIGFENDNALTRERYFKVHGTQNYGVTNFDNYAGGTTSYVIPVGSFYTGTMDRLVFLNDNDAGSGNTSVFSNVKIYEGSCGAIRAERVTSLANDITPVIGDQNEDIFSVRMFPNPTKGNFSVYINGDQNIKVNAVIYDILGSKKASLQLKSGVNPIRDLSLSVGVYLVKLKDETGHFTSVQKLIIN